MGKISPPPSLEWLRAILYYDRTTGIFRWRDSTWNKRWPRAGYLRQTSLGIWYRHISLNDVQYRSSRLAWYYVTGEWPSYVDHKSTATTDDSFDNLRPCTHQQNCCNRNVRKDNKCGLKGVYQRGNEWIGAVSCKGKRWRFHGFESANEAKEFRDLAAQMLHGEFFRS